VSNTSAISTKCRTCGEPITGSSIGWNGWSYHIDHVPKQEPPPCFHVAELQPDEDSPGLWIGFKTKADRDRALPWFIADVSTQSKPQEGGK